MRKEEKLSDLENRLRLAQPSEVGSLLSEIYRLLK